MLQLIVEYATQPIALMESRLGAKMCSFFHSDQGQIWPGYSVH